MGNIQHVVVCPSLCFVFTYILINFSWDTHWPENSRCPVFNFGSIAVLNTKEAHRLAGNLRNGPEEGQKRWQHTTWWDQRAEGGKTGRTGGRAGEATKASTESSKRNPCVPQDIIFFRHLSHNRPHSDWYVLGLLVGPALILDRHLRSSHLDQSTKRHRITSYRPGG